MYGTSRATVTAYVEISYILVLNPMTGNTENTAKFGPFPSKEVALQFHDSERVEVYSDEGPNLFDGGVKNYHKTFRQGGPLEWMNPLTDEEREVIGRYGHGVHECIMDIVSFQKVSPLY